jgi:hypothetical protein
LPYKFGRGRIHNLLGLTCGLFHAGLLLDMIEQNREYAVVGDMILEAVAHPALTSTARFTPVSGRS